MSADGEEESRSIVSDINTHTGTESYFDPPIESYKFIYQNENSGMGFVLTTGKFGSSVVTNRKKESTTSLPETLLSADAQHLANSADSI